jgi:hypothetical protein
MNAEANYTDIFLLENIFELALQNSNFLHN